MSNLASEVRVQEESAPVRRIDASAATILAVLGIAERGPIGTAVSCTSFTEWKKKFGGYTPNNLDVVAAIQGYFDNGGVNLVFGRVVHCSDATDPTTKTSAAGTSTALTASASPTPGQQTSAVQPYNMEPGQTLVTSMDGAGDQTFTFAATAAQRTAGNNATYALADGDTLIVAIDGGAAETKTFSASEFVSIAAATAAEVIASLNAFFASKTMGALATLSGSAVRITSNRRGTGSSVNVSGGTANAGGKLNYTTGATAGTGDVANIDAVTATEVAAKLSGLTGGSAAVVSGAVQITSATTGGSSSTQVKNTSTATAIGFDNAVHAGSAGTPTNTLRIDGKTDGAYTDDVTVQIAAATSGDASEFNLYVLVAGVVRERFFNLSMDDTLTNFVETVVNHSLTGSDLIAATDLDAFSASASGTAQRPANGTYGPLAGGDDGLTSLADVDYIGGESTGGDTGFRLFDASDVDIVIIPGRATSAVQNALVTYCEVTRSGLCVGICDPPKSYTAEQILEYVTVTASLFELSDKIAIYWPNVLVANPDQSLYGTDPTVVVAPSGHLAGLYARTDARKVGGAFEQPAGTEFGLLRNVLGLEMADVRKKAKRDLIFPKCINPISQENGTPIFVDGARTLKPSSAWPSVGQRRGVILVEKKLIPGLAFMRHRNIRPRLYAEGERSVTVFMLELVRNECLKSNVPDDAFYIDFGAALNPASVQFQHEVFARLGLATSEPAEFITILVTPDTRALDAELAALAA